MYENVNPKSQEHGGSIKTVWLKSDFGPVLGPQVMAVQVQRDTDWASAKLPGDIWYISFLLNFCDRATER